MNIIKLDVVNSTNEYLKHKYKSLDNFSIVTANKQTSGNGRNNHKWESEGNKNLLCSLLLKDRKLFKYISSLSVFTGFVVFKLLKQLELKNLSIKWPNDIYVKDKKIAGILVESVYLNNNIEALIIGIGINLNQTKFSSEISATSYKLETSNQININDVLNKLIKLFKIEIFKLKHHLSTFIKTINNNNYLFDKKVNYLENGIKKTGIIKDINKDGTINVLINHKINKLNISEVTLADK